LFKVEENPPETPSFLLTLKTWSSGPGCFTLTGDLTSADLKNQYESAFTAKFFLTDIPCKANPEFLYAAFTFFT
jgi:hypothetical protein